MNSFFSEHDKSRAEKSGDIFLAAVCLHGLFLPANYPFEYKENVKMDPGAAGLFLAFPGNASGLY